MSASAYLVLARKYRPQTFADVIGQEHVTRTLQNAIERGRIHHAFLFCGGRGTGKTTTARILAKCLSCINAPTATPCNQCDACVEITRGTSVDVQEIDAASQNRVEDIRELREAIRYAPVRGKKKLYILDEVHMLSQSAFNALLKTLEEPPPHAVFVFATTDPHKLPQTILSRVQRYDFKLVPTARLVEHLAAVLTQEGIEFDRGALQLVAREGAGSVRDSLSLLDQVLASCQGRLTEELAASILGVADRGLIFELGRAVVARDAGRALAAVDSAYSRGYDLAQLARTFLAHLRDLVVVSVVQDPGPLLDATGAELEELRSQAQGAQGAAELLFDRMVRVAEETSRSPLPRYLLEVGLVELCRIGPMRPLDELVGRLEALEGRVSSGSGGRGQGAGPGPGPGQGQGQGMRRAQGPIQAAPPGPPPPPVHTQAQPPAQAPAPAQAHMQASPPPPAPMPAMPTMPAVSAPAPARVSAPAPVVAHAAPAAVPQPAVHAPPPPPLPAPAPAPALAETPPPPRDREKTNGANGHAHAQGLPDFTQLVDAVLGQAPSLSEMALCRPLRWDGANLVMGFDKPFDAERMREKVPQVRRILAGLGHEVQIDVQVVQGSAPGLPAARVESWLDAEQRKAEEEREARRREALTHPARKALSETFGDVTFLEPELE